MATFSPAIRTKKEYNTVYIRLSHNSKTDYVKTDMVVHKSGIRKGIIINHEILANCALKIKDFINKINNLNISSWTIQELKDYLISEQNDISFTDFAKKHIDKLTCEGRVSSSDSYMRAVNNLYGFLKRTDVYFNELTSKVIQEWVDSMSGSLRKKSAYPTCIKAIFNAAFREYNDYDYNVIRIRVNPFARVRIPKMRVTEKRNISVDVLTKLFTSEIDFPDNYDGLSRKELAIDTAKLIFCLAGINAADLYDLKKSALKNDWKLRYNRKKTREKSDTGAYTEITVPELIRQLFEKYAGKKDNLFLFSDRFADCQGFVKTVNIGLKRICSELNIMDTITTYSFRHSWATIAQNDCGASTEQVAFALNHSSSYKITETYIRKDYSPIDRLNESVIKVVFK